MTVLLLTRCVRMVKTMPNTICSTCKHAIFDAQLGEFKCSINQVTYTNLSLCGDYKSGKPQESKANDEYYESMYN